MAAIVVAGALANKPANGGAAWTRLSWALGFKDLGYDVFFIEQLASATAVDRCGAACPIRDSINLAFFRTVIERFGITGALVVDQGPTTFGLPWHELLSVAESAELLVNISGHLTSEALKSRFAKRIFIDLDPGYTQFWDAQGLAHEAVRGHDCYFTVGENIGQPFCPIPVNDITWHPIRQPVSLDWWPLVGPDTPSVRFTTVASWRGPLGRVQHGDTMFGVKAHEFRKFMTLPTLTDHAFEIALEIDPADMADVEVLAKHRWHVVDPQVVVPDPLSFRRYIQDSSAEFSVAQGIYVQTQSGWFSDRTVRYLASGKPALVQDTGWSRNYPSAAGLLRFATLEEAVDGAARIAGDYGTHSRAARALAEEFFDARKVLQSVVEIADGTPLRRQP